MIQQRKKDDPQAVERRRMSRRANANSRRVGFVRQKDRDHSLKEAFKIARRAQEVEKARRLYRRFFRGEYPADGDIRGEFEYWRLRKYGYDVMQKSLRVVVNSDGSRRLGSPHESEAWLWWINELVPSQRTWLLDVYPNRMIAAATEASNRLRKFERFVFDRL